MNNDLFISAEEIYQAAKNLGWDDVGITDPTIPEKDIQAYEEWLSKNHHGKLQYMENKLRCSPQELFPGAQTAIIFVTYYKQEKLPFLKEHGLIASYARGRDYHHIHRKRLKKFISWLEERSGQKGIAKGFSDSTPILEKALAVKAGLGWMGKNTLLIHRQFGTFTLLSGILTTLKIPLEQPKLQSIHLPRCGSCTRCIDACPSQAISPYKLNATQCLSYHLIESKQPIPNHIQEKNPGYVFGCDICQDVCLHNLRKPLSTHLEFHENNGTGNYLSQEKLSQLELEPSLLFGTPLQRKGVPGLKENFKTLN